MNTVKKFITTHERLIFYLLAVIIVINFCTQIFIMRDTIFKSFDPKQWEDAYNKSQWVVPNSQSEISDADLYVHVGNELIQGHDPSLINAEVPPLGKYLIGITQYITGNVGVFGILFSALCLVALYIFNSIAFKSRLLAITPVVLFSFDPIFTEQIGVTMLDTPYLLFLLLTGICMLKKRYLVAAVCAGLFMATKSPFIIVVLYACMYIYMTLSKEFNMRTMILMPIITAVVYTMVHAQMFLLGHNLHYFLSVQKYMINFYQTGATGVFGAIIPLLFTGYWFTWFERDGFIQQWTVLWPIIFIASSVSVGVVIKNKLFSHPISFQGLWIGAYLAFLFITPVFPRYLLLILPFMYNLSIWLVSYRINRS